MINPAICSAGSAYAEVESGSHLAQNHNLAILILNLVSRLYNVQIREEVLKPRYLIIVAPLLSPIGVSAFSALSLGTILPLGDSITSGTTVAGSTPGGYRDPFYQDAVSAGYSFRFVGSETTVSDDLLNETGEEYHSGYAGAEIGPADPANGRLGLDDEWNNVIEGQDHIQAKYILLLIGTGDVLAGNSDATIQANYLKLLTDIHADDPAAVVLCSSLPPDTSEPESLFAAADVDIENAVAYAQNNGWADSYVDVGNAYTVADLTDPYLAGDQLLGAAWLNAVETSASSSVPEPTSVAAIAVVAISMLSRRRIMPA